MANRDVESSEVARRGQAYSAGEGSSLTHEERLRAAAEAGVPPPWERSRSPTPTSDSSESDEDRETITLGDTDSGDECEVLLVKPSYAELRKQNRDLRREILQLRGDIQELKEDLAEGEAYNQDLKGRLDKRSEENHELREKLADRAEEINASEVVIQRLRTANKKLQGTVMTDDRRRMAYCLLNTRVDQWKDDICKLKVIDIR